MPLPATQSKKCELAIFLAVVSTAMTSLLTGLMAVGYMLGYVPWNDVLTMPCVCAASTGLAGALILWAISMEDAEK